MTLVRQPSRAAKKQSTMGTILSPTKPFMETVKEYAEMTTINGVVYVFDEKFSQLSRAFWFIIGIVLIIISVLLINQGYQNWQNSPIITTIGTTGLPIKDIAFPAITICGLGMVKSTLQQAIINQVVGYVQSTFVSSTNLTMNKDNTTTYLNLLANNGLGVSEFLAATYPKYNISAGPPTIQYIVDRMEFYIRDTAVTSAATETNFTTKNYLSLFQMFQLNYTGFLQAYYPAEASVRNLSSLIMTVVEDYVKNKTNGSAANLTMDSADLRDFFTQNGVSYSDFLLEKYSWASPNMSTDEVILQQALYYIKNQIKGYPVYNLQQNETYTELFARNNLTYVGFLTAKYPSLENTTEPGDILLQQAKDYITWYQPKVDVTLLPNETYRDLFTKNNISYKDFIDAKYPGMPLDMNLTDVIPVLASPQPDAFLQSQLAVVGTYSRSLDLLALSGGAVCDGDGYSYNEEENLCYRLVSPKGQFSSVNQFCDVQANEQVFQIQSDAQLLGFVNLIKNSTTGPLSILAQSGNSFWTDAHRTLALDVWANAIPSDSNYFSQYNTDSPYKYIYLTTLLNNPAWNQFVLQYDKSAGKFVITGLLNSQTAYFVCMKAGNYPNLTQVNDTGASLIDKLMDPNLQVQQGDRLAIMRKDFKTTFQLLDFEKAYESLFEILWHSQLPCANAGNLANQTTSLIKRCEWRGTRLPCSAIFNTFPTDQGMCCTFNMAAADKIFYNTSYQRMIERMQGWDSALGTTDDPDFNPPGTKLVPQAGTTQGLSLLLDAHSDLLSPGSVNVDYEGFVAIIGSSNEYPLVNQKNIQIRPGHINQVGISAIDIQATDNIRSVVTEKRNCYFSDQYQLHLHQNYSQANCFLECQMDYAIYQTALVDSHTNAVSYCTPWFLPKNDSSEINVCDPWSAQAFISAMPGETCTHCLPDCTFTDYDVTVTALPFRPCNAQNMGNSLLCTFRVGTRVTPGIYADELAEEYGTNVPDYANLPTNTRYFQNQSAGAIFTKQVHIPYDSYQVDIAQVNFYFETSTVLQFNQDLSMTWIDFAGQIGGFLGLCDGFSICSLVEIFFWFTCRLWYNTTKNRNVSTKDP